VGRFPGPRFSPGRSDLRRLNQGSNGNLFAAQSPAAGPSLRLGHRPTPPLSRWPHRWQSDRLFPIARPARSPCPGWERAAAGDRSGTDHSSGWQRKLTGAHTGCASRQTSVLQLRFRGNAAHPDSAQPDARGATAGDQFNLFLAASRQERKAPFRQGMPREAPERPTPPAHGSVLPGGCFPDVLAWLTASPFWVSLRFRRTNQIDLDGADIHLLNLHVHHISEAVGAGGSATGPAGFWREQGNSFTVVP